MQGFLLLEDNTRYHGTLFGKLPGKAGEIVFTTAMTGYQECITDPSFYGQILVFTYPLIGNVGINEIDNESESPFIHGLVVKELCNHPSGSISGCGLEEYFQKHGIIGISGVDTRALTRKIRTVGVMQGIICHGEPTTEQLESLRKPRYDRPIDAVTTKTGRVIDGDNAKRVAVMDFGVKENTVRSLVRRGYGVTVLPATTKAETILNGKYSGVLLSNGPGDPEVYKDIIAEIKKMIGKIPIFGICMGHQLLALAHGMKSYKLKYGHRGGNQPVCDTIRQRVYITSQNHGYGIAHDENEGKSYIVSHINANDDTIEGIKYLTSPSFSVQFHPEACPGPDDTQYLFDDFIRLMEGQKNA